ncbi:hypothetical protein AX16_005314 [Volvariella volvacea WC 439]|nr:hypothetical protein AX16_005314 [Volvariella volvacea WC 439]
MPTAAASADDPGSATQMPFSENAVVFIQSNDGLVYKVHKLLLELQCPGLPPPGCPTTPDGTLLLPESSSVLKKVLYYLYPSLFPKPSPSSLSFDEILDINKAMRKYNALGVQDIWFKALWDSAVQSPVSALAYAAEIQNQELFNHVTPLAIQSSSSLPDALSALPQRIWAQWFCYHSKWNHACRTAIHSFPTLTHPGSQEWSHCSDCGLKHCQYCPLTNIPKLLWKLSSSGSFINLKTIDDYFQDMKKEVCQTCSHSYNPSQLQTWRNELQQSIQNIPLPDLTLNAPTTGVVVDSTRTSSLFRFSDADITIRSADGVKFHLHKKHLEMGCDAFPPSAHPTMGEVVDLTESASTLEMLFQFLYARQQPDWEGLPFSELYDLAEAAEKYQVYTAMRVCNILMKRFTKSNTGSVFAYATKHGYGDLADAIAPLFLVSDVSVVCDLAPRLAPNVIMAWVRPHSSVQMTMTKLYQAQYLEHVRVVCNKAISTSPELHATRQPNSNYSYRSSYSSDGPCQSCGSNCKRPSYRPALSALLKEMVASPEGGLLKFSDSSQRLSDHLKSGNFTSISQEAFRKWREDINADIQNIRAFKTFL